MGDHLEAKLGILLLPTLHPQISEGFLPSKLVDVYRGWERLDTLSLSCR